MLVLTRRMGETLLIGNDIEVTVLGVQGNQVRLGVTAPREVRVDRQEIRERISAGIPAPLKPLREAPTPDSGGATLKLAR